jgi:hypothetical protein
MTKLYRCKYVRWKWQTLDKEIERICLTTNYSGEIETHRSQIEKITEV